jgi:DNA topoisomerase II
MDGRCLSTHREIEDTSEISTVAEKSLEEQYSRKTPLEHVLLRPGMYVGPVERSPPQTCWVLDPMPEPYDFSMEIQTQERSPSAVGLFRMTTKEHGLIPALIKIFDEILVNASDNRLRNPKTCTKLDVRIDPGSVQREPRIRIWNNGKGIPIQVHAGENLYIPEMLFGHLLTGSNFDDDEKRLTGESWKKYNKSKPSLFLLGILQSSFRRWTPRLWSETDQHIFQAFYN